MLAGDKSDGESGAEGFLQILTDCLAEGYLLLDYAKANPIADDIELFGQAGIELDSTRVQYILDGIRSLAVDLNDRIGEAEARNFQGWHQGVAIEAEKPPIEVLRPVRAVRGVRHLGRDDRDLIRKLRSAQMEERENSNFWLKLGFSLKVIKIKIHKKVL